MAGFIDCHVHYPQTQIIGAFGEQLIDWLNKYTFIAEQQFADQEHARAVAKVFLQECLRAGTTSAAVYCTVHPQSVDAFFEESAKLGMRMIAGKVLMDRNAPAALTDTPQRGYDESKALIGKWHGKGRLLYARDAAIRGEQHAASRWRWPARCGTSIPAPTCSRTCPRIAREVSWVKELYPERSGYLDVYDHYRQLGPRSIYGHGIWLTEQELQRCHETGTAIAHCPTSNQFLGSGLFNIANALNPERPVRVGLATRYRCRHFVLDAADPERDLQGRAAERQRAVGGPRLLPRDARDREGACTSKTRSAVSRSAWKPMSSCSISSRRRSSNTACGHCRDIHEALVHPDDDGR